MLVKIGRNGKKAQLTYSSGEAADAWRVNPENMVAALRRCGGSR